MRIVIPIIICFLGMSSLSAQSLKAYLKAAEEAKVQADYYTAYYHLQTASEIVPKNMEVQYKFAEAAYAFNAFTMADSIYTKIIASSSASSYPDAKVKLGLVKQQLGDFEGALEQYQAFIIENEARDDSTMQIALRGVESIQWALENSEQDSTIKIERLSSVNTIYSEFSPIRDGDYLYFSSVRYQSVNEEDPYPKPYYSRVLRSENIIGEAISLDTMLNDITKHTGHITFSKDQKRIYYNVCTYNEKMDIICDLYYRDVEGDVWGEPQMLPFPINDTTSTNTQPNIGHDLVLNKDILYFVSDREGGKGGLDIWYSIMDDKDSFSEPVNFEEINTSEDDISPFYHNGTTSIFFSSKGRIGYGGFDVFRSYKSNNEWQEPANMMKGVNSSLDDVHFTLSDEEDLGFVSSNRLGSMYIQEEEEACCFDIYQVELKPIKLNLKVETYDAITKMPLINTTIYLTENEKQDEMIVTQTLADTNIAYIDLNRNKNYLLSGDKIGYDPVSTTFSTIKLEESQEIVQKLYLNPSQLVLEVRVFGKRNREPLPRVNVQLTDVSQGTNENEYNPTGHKVFFTINREEDYKLLATKKGYLKGLLDFNSGRNQGLDTLVKEIYLELGNLEDFLPLAIYFDNDHPDPKSKSSTTDKRYETTYNEYVTKRALFKQKYGKDDSDLEAEVDNFFDGNLLKGKQEFESFQNILDQYLQEGLEFKIFLKGYASPLASEAYNLAIGGRRIKSIQNEFETFRGGILMEYINSGALIVTEKSFGEGDAPSDVSDNPRDTRSSVYSPAASKERRVEIIEIEKDQN